MTPNPILGDWNPWPYFVDKEITVRVRSGVEYNGTLRFWKPHYVKLVNSSEEILVSREEVESIRMKVHVL